VMTRSRMEIQGDDSEAGKKMEGHKQQLPPKPALEPISNFVELEEINEETEDDKEEETPIKEKEKEKKKLKNEKQKEKFVDDEIRKCKSETNTEKKKDTTPNEGKEVPYPLVPSRKEKERHFARFLDIFKKLKMTLPFGEALQLMPLYAKFLKDMLTKKNQYIHSDVIMVEGNCSVVIQRILPPKHKDPGVITISCSIGEVAVGKALIDLGASINLMPFSMCRQLRELEILPTRMTPVCRSLHHKSVWSD